MFEDEDDDEGWQCQDAPLERQVEELDWRSKEYSARVILGSW